MCTFLEARFHGIYLSGNYFLWGVLGGGALGQISLLESGASHSQGTSLDGPGPDGPASAAKSKAAEATGGGAFEEPRLGIARKKGSTDLELSENYNHYGEASATRVASIGGRG